MVDLFCQFFWLEVAVDLMWDDDHYSAGASAIRDFWRMALCG